MMHNTNEMKIEVGRVVLIKGGEVKNKGKESIRILEELFKGEEGNVIRGVKLQTPKSHIERPIQYLYPFELHCDVEKSASKSKGTNPKMLNGDGKQYKPRRTATITAKMRKRDFVAEQPDE